MRMFTETKRDQLLREGSARLGRRERGRDDAVAELTMS